MAPETREVPLADVPNCSRTAWSTPKAQATPSIRGPMSWYGLTGSQHDPHTPGEAVDFQSGAAVPPRRCGAPPAPAPQRPEQQEGSDGVVNNHLNEAQRERLAALESSGSSDEDEANDEDVATRVRGGRTKPVRHQLRRTPTETQQARWEAVQQAREQGLSLTGHRPELGHGQKYSEEIHGCGEPAHQETDSAKCAFQGGVPAAGSPGVRRLDRVT